MAKDFTVAIVGGGLCGLAAAYPLSKAGVSVKVFEAAVSIFTIPTFRCSAHLTRVSPSLKKLGLVLVLVSTNNVLDGFRIQI